jgi:hypothetical protein
MRCWTRADIALRAEFLRLSLIDDIGRHLKKHDARHTAKHICKDAANIHDISSARPRIAFKRVVSEFQFIDFLRLRKTFQ